VITRAAMLIVIERGHQLLLHFVFKHSKVYKESLKGQQTDLLSGWICFV